MKQLKKRLVLRQETVRTLARADLARAGGGGASDTCYVTCVVQGPVAPTKDRRCG